MLRQSHLSQRILKISDELHNSLRPVEDVVVVVVVVVLLFVCLFVFGLCVCVYVRACVYVYSSEVPVITSM